jgi:diadenosine tetraphosphatase ApaH/serine/threonine PP2A family protein phosphatase
MIAILSDIHGNLEALEAVLADATSLGAINIYCLGDIIGYGADSIACLEHATRWTCVLKGTLESVAIGGLTLGEGIQETVKGFRAQLERHPRQGELQEFLQRLPIIVSEDRVTFVHSTPRDPLLEFLYPEEIYCTAAMEEIAARFDWICFCGHTHLPGTFEKDASGRWEYGVASERPVRYLNGTEKLICNVGSVGQPHGGDPNASYVLFGRRTIHFRRVPYDVERAIAKIKSGGGDGRQGDRLREGR